jgi:CRP/FNR family transcriptional regulator, cyclic AMP receptor protein
MSVDLKLLAAVPLFRGLTSVELEEIASQLDSREFKAGDRIMREGDAPTHPIYILLKGAVEVVKNAVHGRDHVISTLSAPSVFGEIEVLARRPAIAGVAASTVVLVAELQRGVFDEMAAQNRPGMLKIIKNLAQTLSFRLAATDEQLAAHFDAHGSDAAQGLGKVRSALYSGWK